MSNLDLDPEKETHTRQGEKNSLKNVTYRLDWAKTHTNLGCSYPK